MFKKEARKLRISESFRQHFDGLNLLRDSVSRKLSFPFFTIIAICVINIFQLLQIQIYRIIVKIIKIRSSVNFRFITENHLI